jgi:hypothetical protein
VDFATIVTLAVSCAASGMWPILTEERGEWGCANMICSLPLDCFDGLLHVWLLLCIPLDSGIQVCANMRLSALKFFRSFVPDLFQTHHRTESLPHSFMYQVGGGIKGTYGIGIT